MSDEDHSEAPPPPADAEVPPPADAAPPPPKVPSPTEAADRVLLILNRAQKLPRHTPVKLPPDDLLTICTHVTSLFRNDPILLKIPGPVNVLSDLHGQFYDLLAFLKIGGSPADVPYLFLGNYVDRGHNRIETISYILALKVKYPLLVWVLRGPQETAELAELYGFADDCRRLREGLFESFTQVFQYLPLAAVIGGRILCVHGGLSPHLTSLSQFRNIERPLNIPATGLIPDLLLADANPGIDGFAGSDRSKVNSFGAEVIREFLEKYDYELLLRGNECVADGYQWPFGEAQPIVTVFSAPDYCDEFANKGAMAKVDDHLQVSFKQVPAQPRLRPSPGKRK
jgi:serine/threonine-protein phosphatase PP1 catalytic subunit